MVLGNSVSDLRLDEEIFWQFSMFSIASNMYIIVHGKSALIIDPNISNSAIEMLQAAGVEQVTVLLTHEHYDHICGLNAMKAAFDTEVVATEICAQRVQSPEDNLAAYWEILVAGQPDNVRQMANQLADHTYTTVVDSPFTDYREMQWENHTFRMWEVAGHSPGSMLILMDEKFLFTGDSLINGTNVICSFPGGKKADYKRTVVPLLKNFPDEVYIFPGHGKMGTMGELRVFAEPLRRNL